MSGFLCESHALVGAEDVTRHGGWRAYLAARSAKNAAGFVVSKYQINTQRERITSRRACYLKR